MIIFINFCFFLFLIILLYRRQLSYKYILILLSILLVSLLLLLIPFMSSRFLLYYILVIIVAWLLPIPFQEVYSIGFLYFMSTIIGSTMNQKYSMWENNGIFADRLKESLAYSLLVFLIFILFFIVKKNEFYKNQKMTIFMNKSSLYILLVMAVFFGLFEFGFFKSLGIDGTVFFQLAFLIIYLFIIMNYIMIYLFYQTLNKRTKVLDELEYKYNDLSKISLDKKQEIVRDLRSLVQSQDINGIIQYTESYKQKVYLSNVYEKLEELEDEYISLIIQNKMNMFDNIHFVLEVDGFLVGDISSTDHFLEIFTIILDNAVQAASKSKEKTVRLLFRGSKVKVSNSFIEEDLESFYKKESTKGDSNRINGLQLLNTILEHSDLLVLSSVDEMVHVEMMVISND